MMLRVSPSPAVSPPRQQGNKQLLLAPRANGWSRGRRGLSLLEVLVAMAIFLFSLLAIGNLIGIGSDLAVETQYQAQAAQLCQAKLAEVVAGVVPLSGQGSTPFDEDENWTWSLESEQGSVANLWNVTVRVERELLRGGKVECVLTQMVLDPSARGSNADAVPAPTSTSSTDTSGATGSSSTGGGAATPTSGAGTSAPAAAAPAASTPAATSQPASRNSGTTPNTPSRKGG